MLLRRPIMVKEPLWSSRTIYRLASSEYKLFFTFLTISSKKSPTSISRGWIAFFIFLKLFQKYDIIKSVKGNKKEYFWSRNFLVLSIGGASIEVIKKYIQGQGGENEDS